MFEDISRGMPAIVIDIMDWTDWLEIRSQDKQPHPMVQNLIKSLYPSKNTQLKAIDCGAGTGTDARWLAMRGFQVKAIDDFPAAQPYLQKARASVIGLRGRGSIEIIQKDLRMLQSNDAADADVVLDILSLSHLGYEDYDKTIATLSAGMKPGAKFFSVMPSFRGIQYHPNMVMQTEEGLRRRFKDFDIQVLEEEEIPDGSPAARRDRGGMNIVWGMYALKKATV
jgi:2-polyprenyl-3-methyl-5-hydroxy-6-metoxy-1,4-benzoquinol methylase